MDAYKLYNIAMEYAEKVWQERSDYVSTYYATITVLISDGGHIYTGITGLTVNYGDIEILRSEKGAMAAMLLDGQTFAKQMVTLSFKTRKFAEPNEDALKALYELDPRNADCSIMIGEDQFTTAGDVIGIDEAAEEAEEAAAAPVEEAPAPEPEVIEEEAEEAVEEIAEEEAEEAAEEIEEIEEEEAEEEDESDEEDEEPVAELVRETAGESDDEDDEDDEDEEEEYESDEEEEDDEGTDADPSAQPDFLMGFDFGDDTGPTSEIVVPKIQKSYEEYDKKTIEKRNDTSYSEGVTIDEDNPFFDAGSSEQKEVVAFADKDAVKEAIEEGPKQPTMTKKEMLKMAKKRKKIAKNNNKFR